jgi:hypothetical protein
VGRKGSRKNLWIWVSLGQEMTGKEKGLVIRETDQVGRLGILHAVSIKLGWYSMRLLDLHNRTRVQSDLIEGNGFSLSLSLSFSKKKWQGGENRRLGCTKLHKGATNWISLGWSLEGGGGKDMAIFHLWIIILAEGLIIYYDLTCVTYLLYCTYD